MMTYEQFMEHYYTTIETEGYDEERDYCAGCPHRATCGQTERYWGCGVWEDSMGEDL